MNSEPSYKVVWPSAKITYRQIALKPRITDLTGKTVVELSDYSFKSEEIFPLLRVILHRKYPGINIIEYTKYGKTTGIKEDELIAGLPEYLVANNADAVISGVGG